jgi:hypothetical protein
MEVNRPLQFRQPRGAMAEVFMKIAFWAENADIVSMVVQPERTPLIALAHLTQPGLPKVMMEWAIANSVSFIHLCIVYCLIIWRSWVPRRIPKSKCPSHQNTLLLVPERFRKRREGERVGILLGCLLGMKHLRDESQGQWQLVASSMLDIINVEPCMVELFSNGSLMFDNEPASYEI